MEPFKSSPLLTRKRLGGRFQRPVYIASIGLHVIAFTTLYALAPIKPAEAPEDVRPVNVVFYPSIPEVEPIPPPRLPDPPPPVKVPEIKRPEPRRKLPPEPVAPPPAPVEPVKVVEPPVVKPPPRPVPRPEPPKPQVRTDVFGESKAAAAAPVRPNHAVEKIGGFEVNAEERPAGAPGPHAVAAGGFETGVATAGFGAANADGPSRQRPMGTVASGGFNTGVMEASKARPRARPVGDPETPVEIVSKAKPVYTDEARRLRIEGEVVLEVTFVASGRLLVHRVVSPLGYGLDEAAVAAAQKIQFTPARRDGIPVDHTATLRVLFRLA